MTKTAFLFPGQGSQFIGMGKDLHEGFACVREIFGLASDAAGLDLCRLCFEGPEDQLVRTRNLQPALAAVNHSFFEVLLREKGLPDFAAGHSLGEYNAYAAAGVLSPRDMFAAVALRGRLMEEASREKPGAMAAVLGPAAEKVEEILDELRRSGEEVWTANHNAPAQTVITGSAASVAKAREALAKARARVVPLAVSGAWHSPFMAGANERFGSFLGGLSFAAPAFPLAMNVTGKITRDPAEVLSLARRQLVSPVRWTDIVRALQQEGVTRFVELGPKTVLSGLVKKAAEAPEGLAIVSLGDLPALTAYLSGN